MLSPARRVRGMVVAALVLLCKHAIASDSVKQAANQLDKKPVTHYDLQYFLPQEFLFDLPLRRGSFANWIMHNFTTMDFPELNDEEVEQSTWSDAWATSAFNSDDFKARRKVCVKVSPGTNIDGSKELCERQGATPPRAVILEPHKGYAGRFELSMELEFSFVGHIYAHYRECVLWIFCHSGVACDDDLTISGSVRLVSEVNVEDSGGKVTFHCPPEATTVSFQSGPTIGGTCHEDWMMSLFYGPVENDVEAYMRNHASDYVQKYLQPTTTLPQVVSMMPGISLEYSLQEVKFVPSSPGTNSGFVLVHASCTVLAKDGAGKVQRFPDASKSWTGKHNIKPLNTTWQRITGKRYQAVLLGGVRLSQELLTMVFKAMDFIGALSPRNSTTKDDALLFSEIDMSQPDVDLSKGRIGAILREFALRLRLSCLDRTAPEGTVFSPYNILEASFSNVTEELLPSVYVASDHSAMGLKLQLQNVSLGAANLTTFGAAGLLGSKAQLTQLATDTLRKNLPQVNKELDRAPILLCDSDSGCSLVPFFPNASVRTVAATSATTPGFMELAWRCQCGQSGYYQQCMGFDCPAPAAVPWLPWEVMQHDEESGLQHEEELLESDMPSWPHVVQLMVYKDADCNFATGETATILAANVSQCTVADVSVPVLKPAFRIARLDTHGWQLSWQCDSNCSACVEHVHILPQVCSFLPHLGISLAATAVADPSKSCWGGLHYYDPSSLVVVGLHVASEGRGIGSLSATRLPKHGKCTPCGLFGNLTCSGGFRIGNTSAANLLCEDCSNATTCVFGGALIGDFVSIPAPVAARIGWSALMLTTPELLPSLRYCEPKRGPRPWIWSVLWMGLAAVAVMGLAAACLLALARSALLRRRCLTESLRCVLQGIARASLFLVRLPAQACCLRVDLLPIEAGELTSHSRLWFAALLQFLCAYTWLLKNPMDGVLESMGRALDVSSFDTHAAQAIVLAAKWRGFALLLTCSLALFFVSLARRLRLRLRSCAGSPGGVELVRSQLDHQRWSYWVVFALFESTAGIALLALVFWQEAFSKEYSRANADKAGDLTLLTSATSSTVAMAFCIKLLLAWIAPYLLASRLAPSVAVCTALLFEPGRALARGGSGDLLQPCLLGLLMTQEPLAIVLGIAYFHSGYISPRTLGCGLLGTVLNFVGLALLRAGSCQVISGLVLSVGQMAVCGQLLWAICDPSQAYFLAVHVLFVVYVVYAAVRTSLDCMLASEASLSRAGSAVGSEATGRTPFLNSLSADAEMPVVGAGPAREACRQRGEDHPRLVTLIYLRGISDWILEVRESRDRQNSGARIKWRRPCFVSGTFGFVMTVWRTLQHNMTHSAWDDVQQLIAYITSSDAALGEEPGDVLEPLVKAYGSARAEQLACLVAASYLMSMGLFSDLCCAPTRRHLLWSRVLGLAGSLACAFGLFCVNMPDYVHLLQLQGTLGHCGAEFAKDGEQSLRIALGAGMLAKVGVDFIPLLVSLPWTLFRIGFFLSSHAEYAPAVKSLMWGTLSCSIRLSVLPATAAYILNPSVQVVRWFLAFQILPMSLMIFIVKRGKTNLVWYLIWGWGVYVVPLLGMARVALDTQWHTLFSFLWRTFKAQWPTFLAEFTVSDVVISDVYFFVLPDM